MLLYIATLAVSVVLAESTFFQGHRYQIIFESTEWSNANADAQSQVHCSTRGHLVSITSQQEHEFVVQLARQQSPGTDTDFWIGFNDFNSEGNFEWTTGEPFEYQNWSVGQPDAIGEHCGQLRSKNNLQWNDLTCSFRLPYIVEFDCELPKSFGGRQYQIVAEPANWSEANADAESHIECSSRGHLVSITSEAENDFVVDLVEKSGIGGGFWIGFNDFNSEGSYEWTTGEPFEYQNWAVGQPDAIGEHCGELRSNNNLQWNDLTCSFRLPYILEFDCATPKTTIPTMSPIATICVEEGGNTNALQSELTAIHTASHVCAMSTDQVKQEFARHALEPAKTIKRYLDDARFVYRITNQRIKPNAPKIQSVARFIPKFGKIADSAVEVFLKMDNILGSLFTGMQEFEKQLDNTIKGMEDIESGLTELSQGMNIASTAAKSSATKVAIAQSCAGSAADPAYDAALELFSCSVLSGVKGLRLAAEQCPRTIQVAVDAIPEGLKTLGETFAPLSLIRPSIEGVADELLAILDVVADEASEGLCCGISPHAQSLGTALTNVINFSECLADDIVFDATIFLDAALKAAEQDFSWSDVSISLALPIVKLGVGEVATSTCSVSNFVASTDVNHATVFIPAATSPNFPSVSQETTCSTSSLDPTNWWGGDCCCQARGTILEEGTACLKFEAFVVPGSYDIASAISGLERCTCCENGDYVGCNGETAVCGKQLPPPKKVNESCPTTGADCFCEGELPCASLESGNYICCPFGSWSSETDFKEYCRSMAGAGEKCPGYAGANDNYCKNGMACGLRASSEDDYICCEHGSSICGLSDCCKRSAEIGEGCYRDDQCKSGLCNCGDLRLCIEEGVCVESNVPVGGSCPTTHDEQCAGGRACARDINNRYICCPNGSWNSGLFEYCREMAEPMENCPGSAASNDNYCKYGNSCARDINNQYICCPNGSWTSGSVEYCRELAGPGQPCPGSAASNDNYCKSGKSCARDVNNRYICCPSGSWTSGSVEYCRSMAEPGQSCPGSAASNDNYCKYGKACGLNAVGGRYICCRSGSTNYWTNEYCKWTLRKGDRCVKNEQCNSPKRDCDCPGLFDTCDVGTCK